MMDKERRLEWSIEEESEELPGSQVAPDPGDALPVEPKEALSEWRMAALLAFLALLFVGGWMWQRSLKDEPPVTSEVKNEVTILAGRELQSTKLERLPWLAPSVLQAAEQVRQAQLASPDDLQMVETGPFSIRFRRIDAEAVIAVTPKLDLLYDKLRLDFGVPVTATATPITIEVAAGKIAAGYLLDTATHTIQVSSPASLGIPTETTASVLLYQSVVFPLSHLVQAELETHYPKSWQLNFAMWKPLADGVRLWTLWEATTPTNDDTHQIVRWLYQNRKNEVVETPQNLPSEKVRRCRTYSTWDVSPTSLEILRECKAHLPSWREPKMPTRLIRHIYGLWGEEAGEEGALITAIGFETVIEYVVESYGRDALPRLMMAMGEQVSWEGLIPAVFSTSAEEFEAGWQGYLANRYK